MFVASPMVCTTSSRREGPAGTTASSTLPGLFAKVVLVGSSYKESTIVSISVGPKTATFAMACQTTISYTDTHITPVVTTLTTRWFIYPTDPFRPRDRSVFAVQPPYLHVVVLKEEHLIAWGGPSASVSVARYRSRSIVVGVALSFLVPTLFAERTVWSSKYTSSRTSVTSSASSLFTALGLVGSTYPPFSAVMLGASSTTY